MKTFIENPTSDNERAFESALRSADLFADKDLVITIEGTQYRPVFTSIEDGQNFGVDTLLTSLKDLTLSPDDVLLINPNDESIELSALDVDTILGVSLETEIMGEDNKSLGLMMALKSSFETFGEVAKAWLVSVRIGKHKLVYLVVEGIDDSSDTFQNLVEVMQPYTHTHDILFADSKEAKHMIQGIKPFYTHR